MARFNPFRKKSATFTPVTPVTEGNRTFYLYGLNGFNTTGSVNTTTLTGQRDAYLRCPAISTIVNNKIQAALRGRMTFVNKDGKEVVTGQAAKMMELLNTPNHLQDWSAFFSMAKTMQQIFGQCYIYAVKPSGFGFESTKQLYVLPNWMLTFEYNDSYISFDQTNPIKKITFTCNNKVMDIAPSDVITWNDQVMNFSSSEMFYSGGSRLIPLMDGVNTIIAAYEAQEQLLTSAGAIGILANGSKDSVGTMPIPEDEKKKLEAKFADNYGLQRDKSKVLITDATLTWQAMTRPTRELMLLEGIEDATRSISDMYGYKMYLLGFKSGSTFNNVAEAQKSLYEETTIPEQQSFSNLINRVFKLTKSGIWLYFDYSDVGALQKSETEKASAMQTTAQTYSQLYADGLVTWEEYRIALGLDTTTTGNTFKITQNEN